MTLLFDSISSETSNSSDLHATITATTGLAAANPVQPFSRDFFYQAFDLLKSEEIIADYFHHALQHPTVLYLFFQRYTHFNAYTSSVISRLASSIAMSRYLFTDPEVPVIEEADRGFNVAMKVMIAAADEGSNDGASHRALAQLLLKTIGDYAGLSVLERNQFAKIPAWLNEISMSVMDGYQGQPGNVAALIRALGFHAASELLGDIEYALVDKVFRHDNQGSEFDCYLRNSSAVEICGHRYHPWCYVLVHSRYEGSGVEASHFECVVEALNLVVQYRPEPVEQIVQWVLEGFEAFMTLEQDLFKQIHQECQVWLAAHCS